MFLEGCKYIVKKKMPEYISDNTNIYSNDSDRKDSDEENSNEESTFE